MLLCSGFPVGYIFLAIFRFYEIYKKIKGNTHETQNIQNFFLEKKPNKPQQFITLKTFVIANELYLKRLGRTDDG